jgi:hypothetical protein
MSRDLTLTERFLARVDKTDSCWLWRGKPYPNGYCRMHLHKGPGGGVLAHRLAYELFVGPIPEGMMVCHNCDASYSVGDISYRRCVNPAHLFLGTGLDNMRDCIAKGRLPRGDQAWPHLHPEKAAWGELNGAYTHPEQRRRGELNGWAKLTWAKVREIRERRREGETLMALAGLYGVSKRAIQFVVQGMTWREKVSA